MRGVLDGDSAAVGSPWAVAPLYPNYPERNWTCGMAYLASLWNLAVSSRLSRFRSATATNPYLPMHGGGRMRTGPASRNAVNPFEVAIALQDRHCARRG